jgi:hypothetical protein
MTTTDPILEFEQMPSDPRPDETDYSVRNYVARIPEEKLARYDPHWSDDQVKEWDGNFRSDGALMLVCCERDVDVEEFRQLVEKFIRFGKGRPAK